MTRMLLVITVILTLAVGCRDAASTADSPAPGNEAIQRILQRHAELVKYRAEAETSLATPSQIADVWGRFCAESEQLDLSACPPDFRVAFRQHVRACRDVEAAIREFPDDFQEGLLIGLLNGLGGEGDGGINRLEREFKAAFQRGNSTFDEVERTALKYGTAL